MKVAWTVRALRDLRAVREYIALDDPEASKRVAVRFLESVERLIDCPASGGYGRLPDTREIVVSGTPFFIPYRVSGETIEILGVIHSARNWPESEKS